MKLFSNEFVKVGMKLPEAWIVLCNTDDGFSKWLFVLRLPLFTLKETINMYNKTTTFGWHIPQIVIRKGNRQLEIFWDFYFHSDFMGEKKVENLEHVRFSSCR